MATIKVQDSTYQLPYQTRGTRTGNIPADEFAAVRAQEEKNKIAMARADCKARGGVWNDESQTCTFPIEQQLKNFVPDANPIKLQTQQPKQEESKNKNPSRPEYITDERGNVTGLILPDGRILKNLSPQNVNAVLSKYNQIPSQVESQKIQPAGTEQRMIEARQAAGQVGESLLVPPTLTEQDILNAVPQETALENLQAGGAFVLGGLAGGAAGAAKGAAVGSIAGIPGSIIGGVGGAILGAVGAGYVKIGYDKRQDVTQAKKVSTIAYNNLGQIIDSVNAGLLPRDVALARWREARISLYAARENLKRETTNDLDRFLSGGADELARVEDQIADMETFKTQEFLLALSNPNPTNIKYAYDISQFSEDLQ